MSVVQLALIAEKVTGAHLTMTKAEHGSARQKKSPAQLALVDGNRERCSTELSLLNKGAALNSRSRNFPCAHLALAVNVQHLRKKSLFRDKISSLPLN